MISNYAFTTLHDYDETFSGLTQFVYADVFEFECEGYHPSSPLDNVSSEHAKNKSSLDLSPAKYDMSASIPVRPVAKPGIGG